MTGREPEPSDRREPPGVRSLGPLLRVVARKQVTLLVRYPLDTVTRFLSMLVFFSLVLFGGRAVAGAAMSDSEAGLVVGFFLWTLSTVAFRGLAADVMDEARWGTLERLFTSPYGFGTVMAAKTAVNICYSLVWAGGLLVATMALSGQWVHLDPLTVVPLAILSVLPVVGVGFALAGLAVLYKRVESLFGLVTFGFVGLIAAPVDRWPLLKLLPMAQGSHLVRTAMTEGVPIWRLPLAELGLLAGTAVAYLLAGYYCFDRAQRRARRQGSLGEY